jgi:hypothetical protein
MANRIGHRVLLCPGAAIVLWAAALTAGFAQQSHSGSTRVLHRRPAPDQPQAGSDRNETIEMNIPVSGDHRGRRDRDHASTRQSTFKVFPGEHLHPRVAVPSVGSSLVGRNAIGLPTVRHDLVQGESAAPFARPFGPPSNRTVGFANRGIPASPSLPVRNRGTIGGVPINPHRTAGLGGPSTPVGGINGTAIRLKY